MAYLKKPLEEGDGQETKFMTSQGSGMIGGLGAVGGLGVAGGPSSGRSPFINPESYRNVQAGAALGQRLGETFTKPAGQISSKIGEEEEAFKLAAGKQKLGSEHLGILGGQVAKTPMSLGADDIGELERRLALQYEGPQKFNPSAAITDPLAKLQERVNTYGVSEPGTGIQREGVRSSLLGDIMKPTATSGQKALENYLLTSSPGALQKLQDTIAGVGGTTTQFAGTQVSPMARLKQARETLAALVEKRQEAALKAQEDTRRDIGLGISGIRGDVGASVAQAIEAAKARQALLTGRDRSVSHIQTKDLGDPLLDAMAAEERPERPEGAETPGGPLIEQYGPEVDRIADLFRGDYTDEERELAARLGLTDEQVEQAQTYMHQLLDPMGLGGEGAGPSLPGLEQEDSPYSLIEDWRDQGYQVPDFAEYTYDQVDPINALYTLLNPEDVYTSEQMITDPQSQSLGSLERLLGGDPSIVRAEDALGGDKMSIDTKGDAQNWLDRLAGFTERSRERADESREGRVKQEFDAKVGPAPVTSGNYEVDKENWFQYRQRLEAAAEEARTIGVKIGAYDAFKAEEAEALKTKTYKEMEQWYKDFEGEYGKPPEEPSLWDRFVNWTEGGYAQGQLDNAKSEMRSIESVEAEMQKKLKQLRQGSGSGGPPTTNVVGGSIQTPTSLPSGQSYA